MYHLGSLVLPVGIVFFGAFFATGVFLAPSDFAGDARLLLAALGASILRLLLAYVLALVVGIALGLLVESNRHIEAALLPVYDVLESLPILAFFPIIILFFLHSGLLEGAAIFMIFFTVVWDIVFSVVGGLKVIPDDVKSVGKVFGLTPWERFTKITLPALFPPLVTGSILGLANGWNILIVAEALHVYAPSSTKAHDLFGIGSTLVLASGSGNTVGLLTAMGVLVFVIAVVNLFIWQPLLARAERYKFE